MTDLLRVLKVQPLPSMRAELYELYENTINFSLKPVCFFFINMDLLSKPTKISANYKKSEMIATSHIKFELHNARIFLKSKLLTVIWRWISSEKTEAASRQKMHLKLWIACREDILYCWGPQTDISEGECTAKALRS